MTKSSGSVFSPVLQRQIIPNLNTGFTDSPERLNQTRSVKTLPALKTASYKLLSSLSNCFMMASKDTRPPLPPRPKAQFQLDALSPQTIIQRSPLWCYREVPEVRLQWRKQRERFPQPRNILNLNAPSAS